jgi:predicted lipoprotein with Yx(FWY)xxD motif
VKSTGSGTSVNTKMMRFGAAGIKAGLKKMVLRGASRVNGRKAVAVGWSKDERGKAAYDSQGGNWPPLWRSTERWGRGDWNLEALPEAERWAGG